MASIPVYVFSGFLDSGKTSCIKETLYDARFNEGESSLIISFEQGEVEYDKKFLTYTNSTVIYLDSIKDLTKKKMKELDDKYQPERVCLELNGMEDDAILFNEGFIKEWELAQTLTLIDSSTFKLYVSNMKQFIYNHVKYAEVVVLNRVDGQDKRYLRNNIKAINPKLEIIYEDKAGNVSNKIDEELFDTSKPIVIEDNDYGLWYMDACDFASKYDNCEVEVNLKYIEAIKEYDNVAIMGRPAMVCCANDITNISLTVVGVKPKEMSTSKFYHLKGRIHAIDDETGLKTCVIYADSFIETKGPDDELVYFN